MIVKFFKDNFEKYPVWTILGDIEQGITLAESMAKSIQTHVYQCDEKVFELTKTNLTKINEFLLLQPLNFKVITLVVRIQDEFTKTAVLKKIEDVPEKVIFIIVAESVDSAIYSRSFAFKTSAENNYDIKCINHLNEYKGINNFLTEFEDYNLLPNTIHFWLEKHILQDLEDENSASVEVDYETWLKFLDIKSWIASNQINKITASEMMLSILELGGMLNVKQALI